MAIPLFLVAGACAVVPLIDPTVRRTEASRPAPVPAAPDRPPTGRR